MSQAPPFTPARVQAVHPESSIDRTLVFALAPADRAAFAWRPGQHVLLRLPDERPPRVRPYSLSGADGPDRPVRITVRDAGGWGRPVYALDVGAAVELGGPTGAFDLRVPAGHDAVFVAGGSGVAPFRAAIEAWLGSGAEGRVTLLHAVRTHDHLVFHDELVAWAARVPAFRYVPALTGDDVAAAWSGVRGRLGRAHLDEVLADPGRTLVGACGPADLVEDALAWAEGLGVPAALRRREAW